MIAGGFPENFLWGTATASHQVEGGNHGNDWWAWEQVPGHIKNGDNSDRACEHFERYASDFDLLRSLNQNAHRLSVEWSRIEPAPGEPKVLVNRRRLFVDPRHLRVRHLASKEAARRGREAARQLRLQEHNPAA